MRDPEHREIERRIASTLEEIRILRVDFRENVDAQLAEIRALRVTSDLQTEELRRVSATNQVQTEELRRVSATNQIQTDALRVALERIHEDERGHG